MRVRERSLALNFGHVVTAGHLFHEQCIRQWCDTPIAGSSQDPRQLRRAPKKNDSCPICRTKIHRCPGTGAGAAGSTSRQTRFLKLPNLQIACNAIHSSSSPVKPSTSTSANIRSIRNHVSAHDINILADEGDRTMEDEQQGGEEREEQAEMSDEEEDDDQQGGGPSTNNINNQRSIVGEMRVLLAAKERDLQGLRRELASRAQDRRTLSYECSALQGRIQELTAELRRSNDDLKRVKMDSSRKSETINRLKAEVSEERTRLEQEKSTIAHMTREISSHKEWVPHAIAATVSRMFG